MNIQLDDFTNVILDGQNSGNVFEACRANPNIASAIEGKALAFVSRIAGAEDRADQLDSVINAANNTIREKDAVIASVTAEKDAVIASIIQEKDAAVAALAANNAEVEVIRARTKQAIETAARYLQALSETELSEAQASAVAGLSGVLQFASKSEIQRQYAEAQAAAAAAAARAKELEEKLNT